MKQLNSLQKYDILWSSVFSEMKQRLNYILMFMAFFPILLQMSKALRKAEDKKPSLKGKPLPESDYLDVFEAVCDNSWDE